MWNYVSGESISVQGENRLRLWQHICWPITLTSLMHNPILDKTSFREISGLTSLGLKTRQSARTIAQPIDIWLCGLHEVELGLVRGPLLRTPHLRHCPSMSFSIREAPSKLVLIHSTGGVCHLSVRYTALVALI